MCPTLRLKHHLVHGELVFDEGHTVHIAHPLLLSTSAHMTINLRYVCCYLVRKNYPLLLPTLDKTGVLSYAEAATVASIFETVVGVVKLFCGVSRPIQL